MTDETKRAPGVQSFLDAAAAHVTVGDAALFGAGSAPTRVIIHDYGWFIHVVLDDTAEQDEAFREAGFSESVIGLLAYARQHECWWINLDQDAEAIEGLPTPGGEP